jgi:UDP-N-acetylglucosamine 2-epimerase (non-hydrolysing)
MNRATELLVVVGARPNFMKVAPLLQELRKHPDAFRARLIHTGQHYDAEMSDVFFQELEMPQPERSLGVGSGSHAEQTARVMLAFEQVCLEQPPDLVVVVGDVNSTMACAITAKKLGLAVAHVEAGLRSGDWTMPEEINRLVTDTISDVLFTPSTDANENLLREGIAPERIHFVGNIMIDCLMALLPKTEARTTLQRYGLAAGNYASMTLHRPSNVDDGEVLRGILEVMIEESKDLPIVWPVHPRSRKTLQKLDLLSRMERSPGLKLIEPVGYLDMLTLNRNARMIITDSGGLQEEATVLGVPCITVRHNTERPATVEAGANQVVGNRPDAIRAAMQAVRDGKRPNIHIPKLWDGMTSGRIVDVLTRLYRRD